MAAVTQKSALEYAPTQLYIGGRWRDAAEAATFAVTDPATGKVLAEVADASARSCCGRPSNCSPSAPRPSRCS